MGYTLENLEIKNPCSINWDEMTGDEGIRYCGKCRHQVYNLSEMPKRRALKILNQPNAKVCVSYLQDEENQTIRLTNLSIFEQYSFKVISAILTIIFSLTAIQAMQTKNGNPKKKRVVGHKKVKSLSKRIIGKPTPKDKEHRRKLFEALN
jgi:hypothetical protein